MSPAGVVLHTVPLVLPVTAAPVWDGAVALAQGRVLAVGPRSELQARFAGARRRDWPGVMLPGLVNAGTSLQLSTLHDLASDRPSVWQLPARVAERFAAMSGPQRAEAARTGAFLALRSGTTALADVVTDPAALSAVARSGLRGTSYLPVEDIGRTPWGADLAVVLGAGATGRDIGVTWTRWSDLDEAGLGRLAELVRGTSARVLLPVAETVEEVEYVALGTGRLADRSASNASPRGPGRLGAGVGRGWSPVEALDRLGWLGAGTHLTQGVHCDSEDLALLARRGVSVALSPRSNRLLRVGRAPVADYLRAGVPLALATGSLAATPSLDLLAEARAARDLALEQGYDAPDLAERIVIAATLGGARALGLADAGRIAPGSRADLAVFDVVVAGPSAGDPFEELLEHGPGACVATVLAGRIVHRRG